MRGRYGSNGHLQGICAVCRLAQQIGEACRSCGQTELIDLARERRLLLEPRKELARGQRKLSHRYRWWISGILLIFLSVAVIGVVVAALLSPFLLPVDLDLPSPFYIVVVVIMLPILYPLLKYWPVWMAGRLQLRPSQYSPIVPSDGRTIIGDACFLRANVEEHFHAKPCLAAHLLFADPSHSLVYLRLSTTYQREIADTRRGV